MSLSANSDAVTYAKSANAKTAAETGDRIEWVKLSLAFLPLATPVSDAKVLTGRQKPLTEVAIIIAEIRSRDGFEGVGFSYSKRAGGQGIYAHAKEIADNLLGEDPNDIDKVPVQPEELNGGGVLVIAAALGLPDHSGQYADADDHV